MKKSGSGWVLTLLRTALCIGAFAYLAYVVPWSDHVTLADGQTEVELKELRADSAVVMRDKQEETLPLDQIHFVEVAGKRVPDVKYGIPSVVKSTDWSMAALAILIFAPVWFIQSYRLVVMCAIQAVRLQYWNAVKLTFAGNFFNFALPGSTGGDLVKAYYLTHYTHQKTEVFTTVFLDRAIGLFGVLVIATGGILIAWNQQEFGWLLPYIGAIFASLILGVVVVFSRRIRHTLRLTDLVERLPVGGQLLRIGRATVAMREHKLKVVASLVLTLVLQIIVMISAAIMAWALGMHGSWLYFMVYIAVGFLIAAIPIAPPQAIGLMEAAYVQFFTQGDLNTASQAVALALAVRLIQLVWALPGVLVPLLGAHRPSKTELAALEAGAAPSSPASTAVGGEAR